MSDARAPKRTVLRLLDEAVHQWGDDPFAFRRTGAGWIPASFRGVRDRAREIAAWLLSTGAARGDAYAILGEGSPEWIMAEFGLLTAGCVSVPLSIKLLEEEIRFRVSHSMARGLFTTRNQLPKVLDLLRQPGNEEMRVLFLDEDPAAARAVAAAAGVDPGRITGFTEACALGRDALPSVSTRIQRIISEIQEDDTVTISYTSGTSGNPKGIMLTHLNYWTNGRDGARAFAIPAGWRILVMLPVDHSFAHTAGLYIGLACGYRLYFVDSRGGGIGTLRSIPIGLLETRPHFLFTVPSLSGNFMKRITSAVEEKGGIVQRLFTAGIRAGIAFNGNGFTRPGLGVRLRSLLPYAAARLLVFGAVRRKVFGPCISYFISGGAQLDMRQQEFFAALGVPAHQGYGLTEAAPIVCANTPRRHKIGTSGQLFGSVEARIVREDGGPAAVGETGRLFVRGDSVMKGYFRNPEATAEVLADGWLWTGDLASMDGDGFLSVVGRDKALLIGEDGEKYSPEVIEEAVASATNVVERIMAHCDHHKYTIALVSLDAGKVESLMKARGITSADSLLALLKGELNGFRDDPRAHKVQAAWIPAVFQIVPEGFSERDGTVNSMLKLVRHRAAEIHGDLIEYSYTREGSRTENPRNLEALRKTFRLP